MLIFYCLYLIRSLEQNYLGFGFLQIKVNFHFFYFCSSLGWKFFFLLNWCSTAKNFFKSGNKFVFLKLLDFLHCWWAAKRGISSLENLAKNCIFYQVSVNYFPLFFWYFLSDQCFYCLQACNESHSTSKEEVITYFSCVQQSYD